LRASDPGVVLTGVDPAFSAPGDIRAMVQGLQPIVAAHSRSSAGSLPIWGVVRTITQTDKAFIAAVNGACGGVAMAFALACDIIIASEKARFVTAFGRIGLVPELGTSWILTRRLGYQKVFELYVSGKPLTGEEAARLGMVNAVVPHEELMARAVEYCQHVAKLPEHALVMSKPLLRAAADLTWEQALTMEEFAEPACFTTQAHKDAIAAFLEKRL
jgi:2-(1,2-epoxy-1,2-dihydrophenyl)acetyl-CoA isomerase